MDDETAESGIDPAMAEMMGFSGFGAQSKKRKFAHDHAFVEGQGLTLREQKKKEQGTGGNMTPLGVRKGNGAVGGDAPQQGNGGAVGEESAGQVGGQGGEVITSESVGAGGVEEGKSKGFGRQKKKEAAPSGLAAFSSRAQTVPVPPTTAASEAPATTQIPEAQTTTQETTMPGSSTAKDPMDDPSASRRGVRNSKGDMVYFSPSFLEDPWEESRRQVG